MMDDIHTTSPSPPPPPPPDTSDFSAADIEIPEPDYDVDDDDDSDNDVINPASSCHDNGTGTERVHDNHDAAADDDDTGPSTGQDDVNQVEIFHFDDVRDKLEVFSREHRQLRGSVPAADEDLEIPEPDYSDNDECLPPHYQDDDPDNDDEIQSQLLSAKKLANPCLESKQHKALCKELIFNQKLGINVLDNKTEYHKEMERRKQRQQRQEDNQRHRENRSTFEVRLEQQANKLHQEKRDLASSERTGTPVPANVCEQASEFLRVHAKISQPKSAS